MTNHIVKKLAISRRDTTAAVIHEHSTHCHGITAESVPSHNYCGI